MPWRDPKTVPLTRISVVSQVPSESGVYAILDGDVYLLVGEAWNLKARLLELMNVLQDIGEFQVIYELCAEDQRLARKDEIGAAFLRAAPPMELPSRNLPGIT
ncbi:MAG TPA: hypothetical protein VER03_24740, partial [Bryobacteraceae bacterium]|nr:hypothetical protein [Bryobacteraceae bacterium]